MNMRKVKYKLMKTAIFQDNNSFKMKAVFFNDLLTIAQF
ncbi:hypothetical protein QF023_002014 [Chryseobacterium sp. SLBN-27]|jgi:hypothetical protein|nr:hypothetical protein [Chryseobacterium sp. SLBN-27]